MGQLHTGDIAVILEENTFAQGAGAGHDLHMLLSQEPAGGGVHEQGAGWCFLRGTMQNEDGLAAALDPLEYLDFREALLPIGYRQEERIEPGLLRTEAGDFL